MENCEACRIRKVTVVDTGRDSIIPFRLCKGCHSRLISLSLRPLEYFNLVAVHGHECELHDDFYDEDGTACQSKIPVVPDETLRFPKLSEIKLNLKRLIDYATVKWWYPSEATEYFKAFAKDEILKELDNRLNHNPHLIDRFLDIVLNSLKADASDWINYQYKIYNGDTPLIFAKAFANCLPLNEGLEKITKILKSIEPSKLHASIWALLYFNSPQVLNWIEENKDNIKIITTQYGDVCAANQFDWETAKKWLNMGRPLSLIALDAIYACGTTKDKHNRNFYLREHPPRLLKPDTEERMNEILDGYLQTDNVHRPRTTIEAIKKDWKEIKKQPPT